MRRLLLILGLAAILALGAGCEFLGWDFYPPELQNVDRSLDMAALVLGQTGYELDHVMGSAVLRADPSLPYHLLVLCSLKNYGGNAVFFLDPLTLAFEAWVANGNAGLPLAVVYDTWAIPTGAGFCAGYLRIDAVNLVDSTTPWAQANGSVGVILQPSLANNLVLRSTTGNVGLDICSPAWAILGSESKAVITGNYKLDLVAAASASSSTGIRLLLRDTDTMQGRLVEFANPEDLVSAISPGPSDIESSGLASKFISFGHDLKDLWLTDKEIIAYEDYDKGKLVRYSLENGSELDSRSFAGEDAQGLSFSSTTSRWYYWDKARKKFLSLRTWW